MTFIEYYIEQWKDIPLLWKIAKKDRNMWFFLIGVSLLLFPMAIFIMYLYDTRTLEVDSRYSKKKRKIDLIMRRNNNANISSKERMVRKNKIR